MKLILPFINKKAFKKRARKCQICEENDFDLLECHRINPGKEYSNNNCVCLCTKCHTLRHRNRIKILGWKNSSKGKLLHYFDEQNKEHFKPQSL